MLSRISTILLLMMLPFGVLNYAMEERSHEAITKSEIEKKTRVLNARLNTALTPLMLCITNQEFTRYAYLFLDNQIDAQDKEGYTALMHAVESNQEEIVFMLISHGANVLIRNNQDQSAFYYTQKHMNQNVAKMLLDGIKKHQQLSTIGKETRKQIDQVPFQDTRKRMVAQKNTGNKRKSVDDQSDSEERENLMEEDAYSSEDSELTFDSDLELKIVGFDSADKEMDQSTGLSSDTMMHNGKQFEELEYSLPQARIKEKANRHSIHKTIHKKVNSNAQKRRRNKNLVCKQCHKAFRKSQVLREHINGVHKQVRPLACQFCDFRTAYSPSLSTHKKNCPKRQDKRKEIAGESNQLSRKQTHDSAQSNAATTNVYAIINNFPLPASTCLAYEDEHYEYIDVSSIQNMIFKQTQVINEQTGLGISPLMYVMAKSELHDYVQLFLDKDINAQSTDGTTALIIAVEKQFPGQVILLLCAGADSTLKNKTGRTALDIANSLESQEIKNMLLEKASSAAKNATDNDDQPENTRASDISDEEVIERDIQDDRELSDASVNTYSESSSDDDIFEHSASTYTTSDSDSNEDFEIDSDCSAADCDSADDNFTRHPIDNKTCPYCEHISKSSSNLKVHIMATHTHEKPYKCKYCYYDSAKKSNVTAHTQRHHKTKNKFSCAYCTYSAKSKMGVTRHTKKCKTFQPKTFAKSKEEKNQKSTPPARKEALSESSNINKDPMDFDAIYVCEECQQPFTRQAVLAAHKKHAHLLA